MMMNIGVGYRFIPSEEEIVTYFLKKRAMGEPFPLKYPIVERELYGLRPPWESLKDSDPWLEIPGEVSKKTIYVFTTLEGKGKTGTTKKRRTAGCGCWHGQTGSRAVLDSRSGDEIGGFEMLSYESHDKEMIKETRGHYIMHQYSISGTLLECIRGKAKKPVQNLVLCKITLDDSKMLKIVIPPEKEKKETTAKGFRTKRTKKERKTKGIRIIHAPQYPEQPLINNQEPVPIVQDCIDLESDLNSLTDLPSPRFNIEDFLAICEENPSANGLFLGDQESNQEDGPSTLNVIQDYVYHEKPDDLTTDPEPIIIHDEPSGTFPRLQDCNNLEFNLDDLADFTAPNLSIKEIEEIFSTFMKDFPQLPDCNPDTASTSDPEFDGDKNMSTVPDPTLRGQDSTMISAGEMQSSKTKRARELWEDEDVQTIKKRR